MARGALSESVDDLQVEGRLAFTCDEALAAPGTTPAAFRQAARPAGAPGCGGAAAGRVALALARFRGL